MMMMQTQDVQSPPVDSWISLIGRNSIRREKKKCVEERQIERVKGEEYRDFASKRDRRVKNEVPPAIPWLARTGNLPSHMPWVFKRYYTEDGRLVIREEKVKHHEYFRADRSDGRLRLQLVPMDDEDDYVSNHDDDDDVDDDDACNDGNVDDACYDDACCDGDEGKMGKMGKNGGGRGKCVEYNLSRKLSSSCIFGMDLPPFRPVHI